MAFRRGRSPCAASAFGRFVELVRRTFCFSLPRVFRLVEPIWQVSLSRLPMGYGSIEYGQISEFPSLTRSAV